MHITSNPLLAFMSIAAYYRALPGHTKGRVPFDLTRVHVDPSENRPEFRLAEVNTLKGKMEDLVKRAGLKQREFDRQWDKTFCTALGLRSSKDVVIPVSKESVTAFSRKIRESVALSRPVLLVRENQIAIIAATNSVICPIEKKRTFPLYIGLCVDCVFGC